MLNVHIQVCISLHFNIEVTDYVFKVFKVWKYIIKTRSNASNANPEYDTNKQACTKTILQMKCSYT